MDTARARVELEWEPQRSATDTLLELLEGMHSGADYETPPLARATSGAARAREFATRVGRRP